MGRTSAYNVNERGEVCAKITAYERSEMEAKILEDPWTYPLEDMMDEGPRTGKERCTTPPEQGRNDVAKDERWKGGGEGI